MRTRWTAALWGRNPIKLTLVAVIALGALGGVASAASGRSSDQGPLDRREVVEVHAQLWNPCDCPEYGRRSASAYLNGRRLFYFWDQASPGDGFYSKEKLLADTLCDVSPPQCDFYTKDHLLTVDSRVGLEWDLYEDHFLSHHVTVTANGDETREETGGGPGDGLDPIYRVGDTAVATMCDASEALCNRVTKQHQVWVGGRP
jgi:hypothetical protein